MFVHVLVSSVTRIKKYYTFTPIIYPWKLYIIYVCVSLPLPEIYLVYFIA